jgi:hypothetical protein
VDRDASKRERVTERAGRRGEVAVVNAVAEQERVTRREHLRTLENTPGVTLPPTIPDIRGWPVLVARGAPAGTVKSLLISSAGTVRAVIVKNRHNQRFEVPLELLEIDQAERVARGSFPAERLKHVPP